MNYVAKAINCTSGKMVTFDSGEVNLASGGWSLSNSFSQPENILPGVFDDAYGYKDAGSLTLSIGITCATPEDARNKTEEILAVFGSKAKVYLFDDRYVYVYPKGSSGKYADRDTRYVDLTLNLTAEPYFLRDVEREVIVTPISYSVKSEMESPDPLLNLTFANYNVTTGVKVSDTNQWTTYITGGQNTVRTLGMGDGFEFDSYGGFAINAYETSVRRFKIWIDDICQGEFTPGNSASFVSVYSKAFTDSKRHRIKLITTTTNAFLVNHISLFPSNLTSITSRTAKCYPEIELSSVDTTVRYCPLGKTAGDILHPITIRFGVATNLASVSVASGIEISDYENRKFCTGVAPYHQSMTAGEFPYYIIEINMLAAKSGIESTWSPEMIQQAMRYIALRFWGYGEGANSGTKGYGAELCYRIPTGWVTSAEMTNSSSVPSLIQRVSDVAVGNTPSIYVDSNGKVYILVKPKYASDGTIASRVYFDHCNFELRINRSVIGTDAVLNRAYNLLPPFSDAAWVISSSLRIIDDYVAEITPLSQSNRDGYIALTVKPNTQYCLFGMWMGSVVCYQNAFIAENQIIRKDHDKYIYESFMITTPIDCTLLYVRYVMYVDGTGKWGNICLIQSDVPQTFVSQEKYLLSFNQAQILDNKNILTIKTIDDTLTLNENNLLPYAGDDYLKKSFLIEPGINHLQFNHTGSLMKAVIKYTEKFNTP